MSKLESHEMKYERHLSSQTSTHVQCFLQSANIRFGQRFRSRVRLHSGSGTMALICRVEGCSSGSKSITFVGRLKKSWLRQSKCLYPRTPLSYGQRLSIQRAVRNEGV